MCVGGAFGYLLLVAVLTFGVFAMHTMGHPEHSSGPRTDGGLHAVVGPHQGGTAERAADHQASAESAAMADHEPAASASVMASADKPVMGMDVLSVCVAVLTGWLLWLFLSAAARRRQQLTTLLARAMAVLRPLPAPPRPSLVQLSLLRM